MVNFENSLEAVIQKFLDNFQGIQFFIIGQFNHSEWVSHDAILLSDCSNGVEFKRN